MIHPLAHVDDNVVLWEGTRIWQFASVIRGAEIGSDCSIASCTIIDGARLGNNCTVGHGASLHPGTWLGDNVFVGPGVVFCNDMWPAVHKNGFDLDGLLTGSKTVIVEDGASIGANSVVLPGVRIGAGAVIAAGSVVTKSLASGHLWRRNGYISPHIPEDRDARRMRFVVPSRGLDLAKSDARTAAS